MEREEQTQPAQLAGLRREQPAAQGTCVLPAEHPSASLQADGGSGPPVLETCFPDVSFVGKRGCGCSVAGVWGQAGDRCRRSPSRRVSDLTLPCKGQADGFGEEKRTFG